MKGVVLASPNTTYYVVTETHFAQKEGFLKIISHMI